MVQSHAAPSDLVPVLRNTAQIHQQGFLNSIPDTFCDVSSYCSVLFQLFSPLLHLVTPIRGEDVLLVLCGCQESSRIVFNNLKLKQQKTVDTKGEAATTVDILV